MLYQFSIYLEPRVNQPPIEFPPELKELISKRELIAKQKKNTGKPTPVRGKKRADKLPTTNSSNQLDSSTLSPAVVTFMKEQIELYSTDVTIQLTSALNTIKSIDSVRLSKPIEELQEETAKKLQLRKKQTI